MSWAQFFEPPVRVKKSVPGGQNPLGEIKCPPHAKLEETPGEGLNPLGAPMAQNVKKRVGLLFQLRKGICLGTPICWKPPLSPKFQNNNPGRGVFPPQWKGWGNKGSPKPGVRVTPVYPKFP